MGKMARNKPMSAVEAKKAYALYAQNIDIRFLTCEFNGDIGKPYRVHGDIKSVKSVLGVTFHTKTMHSTDGKYKVWVWRDEAEKFSQDKFDVDIPTNEEVLRVMLERATGKDVAGNKVVVAQAGV
ncbi:hypothetical protein D6C93_06820 [Aureobasidium pullulans]|nr:hypothetical protein D6C93_06820 [Aureobasidium pullulans]